MLRKGKKLIFNAFSDDETYTQTRTIDGKEHTINFDFCNPLPESKRCGEVKASAVEAPTEEPFQENCHSLTKEKGKGQKVSLTKGEGEDEHLFLEYETDTECGEEKYGIAYEIYCDKDGKLEDEVLFAKNPGASTDCRPVFSTQHKTGCKTGDLNGLWRFVESNSIVFGIIAMVIGAYNLILGRKFIRPTIGLIFLITTVAVILFLFYVLFLPNNVKKWVGWLLLSISILIGGIVGFFASKLVRVGVFFIGVWSGIGVGLLLNNVVFYKINHVATLWVLMAVFGIALGVLSFFWYNYIVIICTSILGSYFFVRGISLMLGGYPNEFTIYQRIANHDLSSVPGTFYAYMVGMLVACALGIFIQITIKRREGKKDDVDVYKRV